MQKIRYIRMLFLAATSSLAILLTGCVREADITYPNTPTGNLEALWHIIDEKYCFTDEKGLDWAGVLPVYQAKVDTMKKSDYRALFDALAEMLDTLQDGHVNLYSSFDVSRCKSWYEGYPANFSSSLLTHYLGSDYKTAGGLSYNLVPGHEKVGYIRYSSFSSGFSAANMWYVLDYFKQCDGIIVDVRNNGGGTITYAYSLASTFMTERTLIGYWQHKTGKGHQDFSALEPLYVDSTDMPYKWKKKVVVLTNRQCYSATNLFVNCMRYAPLCTIIGGKTGGGGGMPMSYELPNGWMIRFSSIRMTDASKISIEPGIDPDEEVTLTSKNKDDIAERAIEIIEAPNP